MIIKDKVGLSAVEDEHLEQFKEWRNLPELRQYFRQYQELNDTNQYEWYDRIVNSRNDIFFSIHGYRKREEKRLWVLIGACGLANIDWRNGVAEISLYVGPQYVNEEASIALGILIDYAFYELNLYRVWAEVYKFDTKKYNLLTNTGFEQEGVLREHHFHDGARHDSFILGLLKSEYV
jgi:RimJ/RimL family protein N-acetyltransferase